MMRALILLTAMCATSATAAVQQHTGTLLKDQRSTSMVHGGPLPLKELSEMREYPQPNEAAVAAARKMISCAMKNRGVDLKSLLNVNDDGVFSSRLDGLAPQFRTCISRTIPWETSALRMSHGATYGLFAEEWFRREGVPNLDTADYAADAVGSTWLAPEPERAVVLRMADCLAARQPARVAAVLRSEPESAPEAQAFAALVPEFAGCLQKDVTLQARKSGVRLALASAYYRRSIAPASSAGK